MSRLRRTCSDSLHLDVCYLLRMLDCSNAGIRLDMEKCWTLTTPIPSDSRTSMLIELSDVT
jgi:hypothetical protein